MKNSSEPNHCRSFNNNVHLRCHKCEEKLEGVKIYHKMSALGLFSTPDTKACSKIFGWNSQRVNPLYNFDHLGNIINFNCRSI